MTSSYFSFSNNKAANVYFVLFQPIEGAKIDQVSSLSIVLVLAECGQLSVTQPSLSVVTQFFQV